jgi:hypothetical protein
MTSTMADKKTDNQGRELITDQRLIHELGQLTHLAAELNRRLHSFTEETSIRPTVLSSVTSATRNAKAAVNHLRAAAVLVQADI